MTVAITPELRQAIEQAEGTPVRLEDAESKKAYVLLDAALYEKLRPLIEPADADDARMVDEMYPLIAEVYGPEGWDDPAMDVYNALDPRRPS